jgi:hypothetical protein
MCEKYYFRVVVPTFSTLLVVLTYITNVIHSHNNTEIIVSSYYIETV